MSVAIAAYPNTIIQQYKMDNSWFTVFLEIDQMQVTNRKMIFGRETSKVMCSYTYTPDTSEAILDSQAQLDSLHTEHTVCEQSGILSSMTQKVLILLTSRAVTESYRKHLFATASILRTDLGNSNSTWGTGAERLAHRLLWKRGLIYWADP